MSLSKSDHVCSCATNADATAAIHPPCARCTLFPLDTAKYLLSDPAHQAVLSDIDMFVQCDNAQYLYDAILKFADMRGWDRSTLMLNTLTYYESNSHISHPVDMSKGCYIKYIHTALHHFFKCIRGDTDEPHDRIFVWYLICIIYSVYHTSVVTR